MDKGKADAVGGKCDACGVVDVVDEVINGTLHSTPSVEARISAATHIWHSTC